jgi:hypothetical protein
MYWAVPDSNLSTKQLRLSAGSLSDSVVLSAVAQHIWLRTLYLSFSGL